MPEYNLLSVIIKKAYASFEDTQKIFTKITAKTTNYKILTPFAGLSLLLDANLSKRQYLKVREAATGCGYKVFPSYELVRAAKEECRPPIIDATITERSASYPLKSLATFTVSRIVEMQKETIIQNQRQKHIKTEVCVMTFSCGCDGSSGQRNYKQQYQDNSESSASDDSSIFATTLVPLRLQSSGTLVYWNNLTPQSIRFCRPIKIQYAKETKQLILDEKESLESQIKAFKVFEFKLSKGHEIHIRFEFYLSIIDGKVPSVFTNTKSSQSCPICGCTPDDFNLKENLNSKKFMPKEGACQFGNSPLHCYIRSLEWLLHVSYRLEIKKWQARTASDKLSDKARKQETQNRLWKELGLRVDFPNANGAGSSNDGNTARRAFQNFEVFSDILGIEVEIVKMVKNLLLTLNCQLPINPVCFKAYCTQLFEKYLEFYDWYKLPASIHKVLLHGSEIVSACSLPLGMLGEEGAEARNKVYKSDRLTHARKNNRLNTMHDVFFRAIDSSDPLLSTQSLQSRLNSKSKRDALPLDVVKLLAVPAAKLYLAKQVFGSSDTDITSVDINVSNALDEIVLENEIEVNY